ncbi:hypothetical protein [Sulfitobacter sp. NFXS29]|uniref:hypothetical protein n=1 Tax=Sulfitobacter sp. NFXS29 TaxID=2818438 RepID=UPI0032DFA4B3
MDGLNVCIHRLRDQSVAVGVNRGGRAAQMLGICEVDIIAPMGLKNCKRKRINIAASPRGGDQVTV